MKFTPPLGG